MTIKLNKYYILSLTQFEKKMYKIDMLQQIFYPLFPQFMIALN